MNLYEVVFNANIYVTCYANNDKDAQERTLRLVEMAFNYYDDIYNHCDYASMKSTLLCVGIQKLHEKQMDNK